MREDLDGSSEFQQKMNQLWNRCADAPTQSGSLTVPLDVPRLVSPSGTTQARIMMWLSDVCTHNYLLLLWLLPQTHGYGDGSSAQAYVVLVPSGLWSYWLAGVCYNLTFLCFISSQQRQQLLTPDNSNIYGFTDKHWADCQEGRSSSWLVQVFQVSEEWRITFTTKKNLELQTDRCQHTGKRSHVWKYE